MGQRDANFVGHEVTCLGFPPIFESLERRGITPEQMMEGTAYAPQDVMGDNGKRIDWETFVHTKRNLGRLLPDEELERIGVEMVQNRSHDYGTILGRLLFTTGEFYEWTAKIFATHIRALSTQAIHLGNGRVILEFELKPGYATCREFFLVVKGQYSVNPTILGFPPNETEMEWLPNGARYDIRYQPAGGRLAWLRRGVMWIWTTRRAADALRQSDEMVSKRYADLLDETRARREAEAALLRIAAEERQRIRRNLHDGVGQELTGLSFLARRVAQSRAVRSERDAETMEFVVDGIERAIGEVQNAIEGLSPVSETRGGLADAIHELVTRSAANSGVMCHFECDDDIAIDDNAVATHLYHIAQEAVTNAVKHAEAGRIDVQLSRDNGTIALSVRDDGVGVERGVNPGTRLGMDTMRHRAQTIGATFSVNSTPGRGTHVSCLVPSKARSEARGN